MTARALLALVLAAAGIVPVMGQIKHSSPVSGVVVTQQGEAVPHARVTVLSESGEQVVTTAENGEFRAIAPADHLILRIEGTNLERQDRSLGERDERENLRIEMRYLIPVLHDSVVIEASALEPRIDRRNDALYKNTLFSRDDQIFQTLDAGINAGQHEGGGKSLEIRRFGFNLDHGGVSGGLKVLVDDVQQNQGTQGHGQGYLGALKSLTPELIQDVSILNGPFSAEYGDFSGLGVVHIRLKESLGDEFTARIQGSSFNGYRTFLAYSPQLQNGSAYIAYEGSRTDGPFIHPLRYKRDNLTANYTWQKSSHETFGLKFNAGRNDFYSSGQIPLDEVAAGRLDRFGFEDPDDGGRVRSGVAAGYYRREWDSGDSLKLDGFIGRSLFDLYSNFTFFLHDQVNGDGIQQHDSRLQEGANLQYVHPFKLFGQPALLTLGGNIHSNQIYVALYPRLGRVPLDDSFDPLPVNPTTKARADVTNVAWYIQQAIDLWQRHLHLEGGLRFDYFRFDVHDRIDPSSSGSQGASRFQPKANVAYTPSYRIPVVLYFNYGRGISSQDARGVVQHPDSPRISTTDFSQAGVAGHFHRFAVSTDFFLIARSNEEVYIPDDGSIELKGPSRAYGYEVKTSLQLTRNLSFNAGLTQVMNAFYRSTVPTVYVDSAPHTVGNAALTLSGWHGFNGSLRYRHTGNYRLDGTNATIRASGLDVIDLSVVRKIKSWLDFNFAVDNLTNKHYYETQNYFESRLNPGDDVVSRIHGTPGYPTGVTIGLTFHVHPK